MTIPLVTFGGGGGHAQVLKGLRTLKSVRITAVCPSTDSGGSTGGLRRDYDAGGYLGDLTKCVAALCSDSRLARALMHRFSGGALDGHSVKNLLLLGLEQTLGRRAALEQLFHIAGIAPHRVLPVTDRRTELRARLRLGNVVHGETNIDCIASNPLWHPDVHAIESITLSPDAPASADVLDAVREARMCIFCPGDLYSSLLPTLLPRGMKRAFAHSRAKLVLVLNIMTKQGETDGYHAEDFIARVERATGRRCDIILANGGTVPMRATAAYAVERKVQMATDELRADARVRVLPFVCLTDAGLICHDEHALARAIRRLL
ncbi:MAG: YvcK family protein [Candidatus Yanofskybacteria bacterium]|nr:YvcK family protein [Candidatus Yanofskybacteria bacterium]